MGSRCSKEDRSFPAGKLLMRASLEFDVIYWQISRLHLVVLVTSEDLLTWLLFPVRPKAKGGGPGDEAGCK